MSENVIYTAEFCFFLYNSSFPVFGLLLVLLVEDEEDHDLREYASHLFFYIYFFFTCEILS